MNLVHTRIGCQWFFNDLIITAPSLTWKNVHLVHAKKGGGIAVVSTIVLSEKMPPLVRRLIAVARKHNVQILRTNIKFYLFMTNLSIEACLNISRN